MALRCRSRDSGLQVLLAVAVACCFFQSAVGNGSCFQYTSTLCTPFVKPGTWVWVPPGGHIPGSTLTPTQYVALTLNVINSLLLPEPCRSTVIQTLCVSSLRPCVQLDNATLPLPVSSCRNLCETVCTYSFIMDLVLPSCGNSVNERMEQCLPQWERIGLPIGVGTPLPSNETYPLTCNETDPDAQNTDYYPVSFTNYTVSNLGNGTQNIEVPCIQQEANVTVPRDCQSPLVLNNAGDQCGFECPLPSLSDAQYDNAKTMQGVIGWISWVTSSVLLLSYALNPKLREFPRNLVLMVALAANIAAGAIIMPSYAGYQNIWCGGSDNILSPNLDLSWTGTGVAIVVSISDDELVFESSACTFQGAMIVFSFLAAVFWWAIIAFNMCFELYLSKLPIDEPKYRWPRFGLYLLVGWGIPFLFMLIPAAASRIKFASAGTYCFISPEDSNAYQLAFWFIPVGLCLVIGSILFVLALIRVIIISFTLSKAKVFLVLYVRVLLFVFIYLFLFAFIFSYNIQIETNKSTITNGYEAYYLCLIRGITMCSLDNDVSNYDLVMLKGFAISSLGFFVFSTFMSWEILRFWFRFARTLWLFLARRERLLGIAALNMILYLSAAGSTLTNTGKSLTISEIAGVDEEEEFEDEDEEDEDVEEDDAEEGRADDNESPPSSSE